MVNKIFTTPAEAVAIVPDGASVMIGGFMRGGGIPYNLIDALIEREVRGLTLIANNYMQTGDLVRERQAAKVIMGWEARVRYDPRFSFVEDAHRRGEIEVEAVPFGTLTQRIQAWAAGIAGFY